MLVACDLGTGGSSDPSVIAVSPGAVDLGAIGDTLTLRAEVRTEDGTVLQDLSAQVAWMSSDNAVVTVSTAGLVTAVANGDAVVRASAGGLSRPVSVSVTQRAERLERESGHAQAGTAGQPLAAPLVVRAFDRLDNPAVGVSVTFQVTQGGGAVAPTQVQTDAQGRASGTWTLGAQAGVAQLARSYVTFRVEAAADFTATSQPGPAAEVVTLSGAGQSAPRLSPLPRPLVVRIQDALDNPVPGVSVAFAVTSGQGSFQPAAVTTDSAGVASSSWTLGSPLGSQSADVTAGSLSPVAFTALATEVPAQIVVLSGSGQVDTVGQRLPDAPQVRILDASSAPIPNLDVQFAAGGGSVLEATSGGPSQDSLVVRTDPAGVAALGAWILGTVPGAYQVSAQVPGLSPSILTATALTGAPTEIERVSGDGQRGAAGAPLPQPLMVRVTDDYSNPVEGVTVSFAPDAENGSAAPAQATTGMDGRASTQWTIGSSGGPQFLTASIPGTSVVFSGGVTGLSGLEIELDFIHQPTASQRESFDDATARWASLIPGRLTPQQVSLPAGACVTDSPALTTVVDDLHVFVRIAAIDQAFGTLARAGVCVVRPGGGLPVVAHLTVDIADIARMESQGALVELLLHELAHTMGFGTIWSARGLLVNPSLPNNRGADTHFRGVRAIAAFDAIGGSGYGNGQKVPVENQDGGAGTRDSHWRQSVLLNELMTGTLSPSSSPLSRLTVASLEDLGYEVDELGADPFQIGPFPAPPRAPAPGATLPLGDDVLLGPIYVVGPDGRIRGILEQ